MYPRVRDMASSTTCFMSAKDEIGCGENNGETKLVPLSECKSDITAHLRRCHLTKEDISESELILLRAGYFSKTAQQVENMFVCPRHRANLGKDWRNQTGRTACHYPDHKGKQKSVKSDRVVTVKIAREVMEVFDVAIPVGSPLCNSCRKSHKERLKNEWKWLYEGVVEKPEQFSRKSKHDAYLAMRTWSPGTPGPGVSSSDPPWTPGQWREEESDGSADESTPDPLKVYNDAMSQIASLTDMKTVEQLTFRLASDWESASANEKALCEEKVDEACQAVCKVIAPNASDELLNAYKNSSTLDKGENALIAAYRHAPTKNLKTQILSIYALQYSFSELKKMHGHFENLSDRQIKKARAHAKTVGAGLILEKAPFHRTRIDLMKLNHFLSFADQPYFYQDVSYGTRTLKLDSGEQLVMPNVVRTVARSTTIAQYFSHCRDEEFEPLGRSTLFQILKVRKSSQRKSLQGLDNTAASGADGFDALNKIIDRLEQSGSRPEWCQATRKELKEGKRYPKTEYRAHCREGESPCPDHCGRYALSDPQSTDFQASCNHEHYTPCQQCESLKNAMISILTEIQSPVISLYGEDQKEDLLYDAKQAQDMVLQWKAHILRAENQDQAKQDALRSLPNDSILVLMDWAMKFNQMKYREKRSEWYGKRGMSWHVSCVISKPAEGQDQEIVSYVHLLDSYAQDWYAVCAILTHLLTTVKAERPYVNTAYIRSDGAGCYHNNNLIAAVSDIGKQVKGTTAAVCELDCSQSIKVDRVSNFSSFHNFSYEAEGVRVSKAYEIGPGKLIPWSQLNVQRQGPILVREVNEQGFFAVTPRQMKLSLCETQESEKEAALFECKEPGCSSVFKTFDELQDHIHFGEHVSSVQANQESIYDRLRRDWALKFATMSIDSRQKLPPTEDSRQPDSPSGVCKFEASGWALQKPRGGGTRFSENVRSYLTVRFDVGAQTGRKADPVQVAADMRTTRNADGSRRFPRDEWLTKEQVQSFFSRLSALRRRKGSSGAESVESDDEGDLLLQEEVSFLNDKRRDKEVEDIFNNVGVMHPMMYDGYDICEQTKQEGLSKFNVKTLKAICNHFELPFKSKDTKATLVNKITDMVKECSCCRPTTE
ncbi:hypothetical protein ACROYT_G033784 [Oculina patagonica]